jgi:hypothetical protein
MASAAKVYQSPNETNRAAMKSITVIGGGLVGAARS